MKRKILKQGLAVLISTLMVSSTVTVYADESEISPQEQQTETMDQPEETSDENNTETIPDTESADSENKTPPQEQQGENINNSEGTSDENNTDMAPDTESTDKHVVVVGEINGNRRVTLHDADGNNAIAEQSLDITADTVVDIFYIEYGHEVAEKYRVRATGLLTEAEKIYVGKYGTVEEAEQAGAENITDILISGDGYVADYRGDGVTFSVFMPEGKAVTMSGYEEPRNMYYSAVRVAALSDLVPLPDNDSGSDSSSNSDNGSGSDESPDTDNEESMSATPFVPDVKTSGEEISVAGVPVRTSVAGAYTAKKVRGMAVTSLNKDVRSNLKLSDSQTPYIMVFDTDTKKSGKAMDSINAVINALGDVRIVAILNIDLGARESGKYIRLSDGSVSVVVGLPKETDTTKSVSIICVRPGGQITVLEDTDTNPNTVTFEVQAGLGTYAIITK